jgi:hypothetical protein
MSTVGATIALGAGLFVGSPANAAPAGTTAIQCRVDNWLGGGQQFVTYSNCANTPVTKRAIINGESGPCVTVPAQKEFQVLFSRPAPGPFTSWPFSVENC